MASAGIGPTTVGVANAENVSRCAIEFLNREGPFGLGKAGCGGALGPWPHLARHWPSIHNFETWPKPERVEATDEAPDVHKRGSMQFA